FRLELGLPVWVYTIGHCIIEKRILLPHGQNTVHIQYRLVSGEGPVRLKLRPSLHFRAHEAPVSEQEPGHYSVTAIESRYEVSLSGPGARVPGAPLRLHLYGHRAAFTLDDRRMPDILYRYEEARGYDSHGSLWSPGFFRADLTGEFPVTLVASTESWEMILALAPEEAFAAEHERRRRLLACAVPAACTALPP